MRYVCGFSGNLFYVASDKNERIELLSYDDLLRQPDILSYSLFDYNKYLRPACECADSMGAVTLATDIEVFNQLKKNLYTKAKLANQTLIKLFEFSINKFQIGVSWNVLGADLVWTVDDTGAEGWLSYAYSERYGNYFDTDSTIGGYSIPLKLVNKLLSEGIHGVTKLFPYSYIVECLKLNESYTVHVGSQVIKGCRYNGL